MTPRIPLHAPPAAPAVLVSAVGHRRRGRPRCPRRGRLRGRRAGPVRRAGATAGDPVPAAPVAAVSSASPTVADPLPPRPGQPLPTATELPARPASRSGHRSRAGASPWTTPPPRCPTSHRSRSTPPSKRPWPGCGWRPPVTPAADVPASAALAALDHAFDQVGDPYVWGATGPDTFDCSGLMLVVLPAPRGSPCRGSPATSTRPAASRSPSTTCCPATWSSSPPRRGTPAWSTTSACTPAAG